MDEVVEIRRAEGNNNFSLVAKSFGDGKCSSFRVPMFWAQRRVLFERVLKCARNAIVECPVGSPFGKKSGRLEWDGRL